MSGAVAGRAPRNIILLSDGTGASALSFNKSNVWRVFTTLDLGPNSNQIAYYDDGVGTSGIKWLRALGGGFGWGLSRNVRQMYEFLCRHYQPGDRIYIFGFSRGAFTVRVLAHLIGICGILDRAKGTPGKPSRRMETDRGLRRGVKQAYKSYRRHYWDEAWGFQRMLAKPFRAIRNLVPGWRVVKAAEFKDRYGLPPLPDGERLVEFIGVWDTVDALGLPVDELSDLLDKLIYPYKFPDQEISDHVERACHALAIDDERETFHPVLWDESDSHKAARVKQVWFVGMHSNVGGGYPEDNLGFITLDWMLAEACDARPGVAPLKFNAQKLAIFKNRGEPVGKLYDSRRGGAVYYRYKPRYIADLCNQHVKMGRKGGIVRRARISVPDPRIHHTVLARIADSRAGYAPVGLPPAFSVVDEHGQVVPFSDPAFDNEGSPGGPPAPHGQRAELLERTRDHVFWRRFAYFSLLLLTFAIVWMPVYEPPIPGWEPSPRLLEGAGSKILMALFDRFSGIIPGFATYWTDAWIQAGWWFIGFFLIGVVIFVWSYWIEGNLRELSEGAYWHVKGSSPPRSIRKRGIFERLANRIRLSNLGRRLATLTSRVLVPAVFAIISLYVIVGGAYRLVIHYPFVKDGVCRLADGNGGGGGGSGSGSGSGSGASQTSRDTFSASDPCFNTGYELRKRKRYRVTLLGGEWDTEAGGAAALAASDTRWSDAGHPATFAGLESRRAAFLPGFLVGLPARRHLAYPWFTLVGEIGTDSGVVFPLNQKEFVFQPKDTGPLYLYVNDAIGSPPFFANWRFFYENNTGSARVIFEREGGPKAATDPNVPTVRFEELKD